jgi:hypothetical protein
VKHSQSEPLRRHSPAVTVGRSEGKIASHCRVIIVKIRKQPRCMICLGLGLGIAQRAHSSSNQEVFIMRVVNIMSRKNHDADPR